MDCNNTGPPPSMGFSRQEYWSGLPFPSPGNLPNPGIEAGSPSFRADALTSEPPGNPRWEDKESNEWEKTLLGAVPLLSLLFVVHV